MEENRKPVISGAGQNLKKTKKYYFWGSGFANDDEIEIRKRGTGELLWSGTVKVKNGMAEAKLTRKEEKGVNVGELELVDVTVTNSSGTQSDPYPDEVMVVDFP